MMTLIEIQRASSLWKLRQLYVQGPVLTVHNETPWHDQPDGDFSSAIRLGIGLRHSWAWDEPTFCLRVPQLPPLVLAVSAKRSCSHGGAWVPWKFFHWNGCPRYLDNRCTLYIQPAFSAGPNYF